MDPATCNLLAYRGTDLRVGLVLYQDSARTTPADLSGWTLAAQIRPLPGAPVQATASVSVPDAAAGEVLVVFPATSTAALVESKQQWDLIGTDSMGTTSVLVEGTVGIREPISTLP